MFEDISPAGLVRQIDAGAGWQIVDVREAWEIGIASVEQSIHIPIAEIPLRQSELDADKPVAVLCHSGGRSARVAEFLCAQGFSRVANVDGGIDAWSQQVDATLPRY